MNFATLLVIVLWVVLTAAFANYAIKCFARSVAYWRIKSTKMSLGNAVFGLICLGFSLVTIGLFLETINSVFITLSETNKKIILFTCGSFIVVTGLIKGVYIDLVKLKEAEEKE